MFFRHVKKYEHNGKTIYKLRKNISLTYSETFEAFQLNENEIFDGNNKTIKIKDSERGYTGLFKINNSISTYTYTYAIVKNLKIKCIVCSLPDDKNGGGIIQYNSSGFTINNCVVDCSFFGNTNGGCGGICGSNCNFFIVRNSIINGDIYFWSGGICGSRSANANANANAETTKNPIIIDNCIINGNIYSGSGGFFGRNSINYSNLFINNCTVNGNVDGNSGGIFGMNCIVSSNVVIRNFKLNGCITSNSGGIFAYHNIVSDSENQNTIKIFNFGINGNIDANSAGIGCTPYLSYFHLLCKNVIVNGNISNNSAGFINFSNNGNGLIEEQIMHSNFDIKITKCKHNGIIKSGSTGYINDINARIQNSNISIKHSTHEGNIYSCSGGFIGSIESPTISNSNSNFNIKISHCYSIGKCDTKISGNFIKSNVGDENTKVLIKKCVSNDIAIGYNCFVEIRFLYAKHDLEYPNIKNVTRKLLQKFRIQNSELK